MSKRQFDRKRPDVAEALQRGWTFSRRAGSGHLIFMHPGSAQNLVLSCSASDYRATKNAVAWIRRNTPEED